MLTLIQGFASLASHMFVADVPTLLIFKNFLGALSFTKEPVILCILISSLYINNQKESKDKENKWFTKVNFTLAE